MSNDLFDAPVKTEKPARKKSYSALNFWLNRAKGRAKLITVFLNKEDRAHQDLIEAFDMAKASGDEERVAATAVALLSIIEITYEHIGQEKAPYEGMDVLKQIAAGGSTPS